MTIVLALAVASISLVQMSSVALLPVLPDVFGTDLAAVSWVATSTLVVGAAVNPVVGRFGDTHGKRTLLLACLAVTAAGSVLGAVATSLPLVVLGRAVQGAGAGVVPLAYGMLRDAMPAPRLPRAVSVITAAGAALGAGLAPVTMGAVVTTWSWRAVFWVGAGGCVVALVLVALVTRPSRVRFPAKVDGVGAVTLAGALVLVLLAVTRGSAWGWASPPVAGLLIGGAVVTWWWLRWERTRDEPIVDLQLSGTGPVRLAHVAGIAVGFAMFSQYIGAFTLVTGDRFDRSATVAGLAQLPGAVVLGAAVMLGSRLHVSRGGGATLLRIGTVCTVVGFVAEAIRHETLVEVVVTSTLVSAGMGLMFCAPPLLIMEHVAQRQMAAVNALNALARVIGSVLASAIVASVLSSSSESWTFVAAFLVGAIPAAIVGVWALPGIHHEVNVVTAAPVQGGTP